jgi:predicted DNA-binding transcriptional regulator AlpA
MTTPSALLSAKAKAALLSMSKRRVFRFASAGQLPGRVEFGRLTRWRREEIEKWLREGRDAGAADPS